MRRRFPYFFFLGLAVFLAFLNYMFGSPLQAWAVSVWQNDGPLIEIPLLLIVLTVIPIVVIINLRTDK